MVEHGLSAGGIVVGSGGKIALTYQDGAVWSLPKGHLDDGEDAQTAARREIAEETGITQLEYIEELGSYNRFKIGKDGVGEDQSVQKTITIFLFRTSQKAFQPTDSRHSGCRWVDAAEVADLLTHPKDQEFYKSVLPKVEEFINKQG